MSSEAGSVRPHANHFVHDKHSTGYRAQRASLVWSAPVRNLDGEPAIAADTLCAATEVEREAPDLRTRADSIADVLARLAQSVLASHLSRDARSVGAELPPPD